MYALVGMPGCHSMVCGILPPTVILLDYNAVFCEVMILYLQQNIFNGLSKL